tara:strand:+ start:1989 stop:2156 length:168 start_codon:yes stop_codon:yes gene_type:complete
MKAIEKQCESRFRKRCHNDIRTEPQRWRGITGFYIILLEPENKSSESALNAGWLG